MTAVEITVEDLLPFAPDIDPVKAAAMIEDAMALALVIAPCIEDDDFAHASAAKAILRGAILRWDDSGSGALASTQESAGPFSHTTSFDTRQERKNLFTPYEIGQLERLCGTGSGKVFMVDTLPDWVRDG